MVGNIDQHVMLIFYTSDVLMYFMMDTHTHTRIVELFYVDDGIL